MAEYEGTASEDGRSSGAQPNVVNEEPTIDRVKELLFGQEQRRTEDKIDELKEAVLAVEQRVEQKIETLQNNIDALHNDVAKLEQAQSEELRERLSGIGEAFAELGKTVSSVVGPKQ